MCYSAEFSTGVNVIDEARKEAREEYVADDVEDQPRTFLRWLLIIFITILPETN